MKMVLPYNFQQKSLSNSKAPWQTQRSGAGVIYTNNPYGKKHGITGAETTRGGTIDALQFKDKARDGVSTTHQNISVRKTNYFEQQSKEKSEYQQILESERYLDQKQRQDFVGFRPKFLRRVKPSTKDKQRRHSLKK